MGKQEEYIEEINDTVAVEGTILGRSTSGVAVSMLGELDIARSLKILSSDSYAVLVSLVTQWRDQLMGQGVDIVKFSE